MSHGKLSTPLSEKRTPSPGAAISDPVQFRPPLPREPTPHTGTIRYVSETLK